jgi:hypothetical protein
MPRPRLLLLVGFCWGNPSSTAHGTLVVSDHVVCANVQRALGGQLRPRADVRASPMQLGDLQQRQIVEELRLAGQDARCGWLASAETLYMDSGLRDELLKTFPAILGGEMEAFAFIDQGTPWLVLKAVSDAGGSDFNRSAQKAVAQAAAAGIAPLLSSLEAVGAIKAEDPARTAPLRDVLDGGVLQFDSIAHRSEDLNDVLDRKVGSQVEYKLRRYLSPEGYGHDFLRHGVDALLELVQNAVRYGKATRATVKFEADRITYLDDGAPFDSRALVTEGKRGGKRAMTNLLAHEERGELRVRGRHQSDGNEYIIELPLAHAALAAARDQCRALVRDGVIGESFGRPVIIEHPAGCSTLYFDATAVRMSSRKYILSLEIQRLVSEGKTIYVGCSSDEDVAFFSEEFRGLPSSKVMVFLDASLPSGFR